MALRLITNYYIHFLIPRGENCLFRYRVNIWDMRVVCCFNVWLLLFKNRKLVHISFFLTVLHENISTCHPPNYEAPTVSEHSPDLH